MEYLKFNKYGIYLTFGIDNDGHLLILNVGDKEKIVSLKENRFFNAFEVKITGLNPDDHHGAKHTGGCSPCDLKYKNHTETDNCIIFELENHFLNAKIYYEFFENAKIIRSYSKITNISKDKIGLEYVSSFCMYGFEMNKILIPHNAWCRELDWREYTPEELGFNRINKFSTKRISISNTGTWSTKEYLPMGCIKNDDETILWQIENNGSWNWEISDICDTLYLKLSGPSEQENGWWKNLKSGEEFVSVPVAITIVSGGFDNVLAEMTSYRRNIAYRSASDKFLPVVFNDYMGCLFADPTTEKEIPVIDAAARIGAEIYCMDAGWYADGTWWETVGEWEVCEKRFPGGMKKVFDYIREKGMKPGIWLEPESMGINCPILNRFDDSCFFMRHGKRVIDHGRYQLDFRNKKVTEFLDEVVDRLVNDYGIEYFKFDYNIDGGVGTETNADSFGDGLMQHNEAFLAWIDGIYERHPYLIIENCASGGMRMDYRSLSHFSLQSLTDAEKFEDISTIAAMSSTAVIPEQSAVWCLPKKDNTLGEIACSMVGVMFRRIHLSGETPWLNDKQFELVKEAVSLYKETRHLIGTMNPFYPLGLIHFEDGIKCSGYRNDEGVYLQVVNISEEDQIIEIPGIKKLDSAQIVFPANMPEMLEKNNNALKIKVDKRSSIIIKASN